MLQLPPGSSRVALKSFRVITRKNDAVAYDALYLDFRPDACVWSLTGRMVETINPVSFNLSIASDTGAAHFYVGSTFPTAYMYIEHTCISIPTTT